METAGSNNISEDRRKHPRVNCVTSVTLEVSGCQYHYDQTRDIGVGGIFVCTDSPLALETEGKITLTLALGRKQKTILASFKTSRIESHQECDKFLGMGLRFTKLDLDSALIIQNIVKYQAG